MQNDGQIVGSFVNEGVTNYIDSVILQDINTAGGYFWGNEQSGSFLLQ